MNKTLVNSNEWWKQFKLPVTVPLEIDVFITGKFEDIIEFQVYCYSVQSWRFGRGSRENGEFSVSIPSLTNESELNDIKRRILNAYAEFGEFHTGNWKQD